MIILPTVTGEVFHVSLGVVNSMRWVLRFRASTEVHLQRNEKLYGCLSERHFSLCAS